MGDKKDSLIVRKIMEQVQEFDGSLTIENLIINDTKYNLEVCNKKSLNNKKGYLHLTFNSKDKNNNPKIYTISINEEGIKFSKGLWSYGDYYETDGIETYHLKTTEKNQKPLWHQQIRTWDKEDYFRVEFED